MASLPAVVDPAVITTIKQDINVQVIDVLDIQTPLSVQIERLEAHKQNLKLLPEDESEESIQTTPKEARGNRMCKYTVRDSVNNCLFLVYLNAPAVLPTLGSVLTIKAGCDLHRGILLATPQTAINTGTSGPIPCDQLERLEALLANCK